MITKALGAALIGVAASAFVATPKANAATIPDFGTYQMGDAFPTHGLWFSKELVDTNGNGLKGHNQQWSVESAELDYREVDGGPNELDITGVVRNNGYRLQFDFSLFEIPDIYDPACGRNGCEIPQATQAQLDGVRFFNFPDFMEDVGGTPPSATIIGLTGSDASKDLTGLAYDLDIRPDSGPPKPPQFGYCANWVDCSLGYSNWFDYTKTSDATATGAPYTRYAGNGDLNLSQVPLPAAGWMLLAAVGGLAARSRFRRS
ncbi:MAG: VPLPA-CTERM sorting domain-containing protein [Pseudomonadota bacterium]